MVVKFIILIFLAWLLIRVWHYISDKKRNLSDREEMSGNMVACDTCHVHVPISESISENGKHYCCRDHLPPS